MSIYLYAKHLYVTTGPATARNHAAPIGDGKLLTNTECPTGTILAIDADGNVYICVNTFMKTDEDDCWPDRNEKGFIELFRDYWRSAGINANQDPQKVGPYFQAILNAPRRVIKKERSKA